MTWHYTATPDQVQPELGPDLLDGDYAAANPDWALTAGTWSRTGGGRFALTVDDPHAYLTLTPDAVYTITVEVRGAEAASWEMALQNDAGEQATLPVGDADTIPADDWVTVRANWRAPVDPLTGSPALTATGPGLVEVRNPVMAAQTGRVVLTVPGDVLAEQIMASGGIIAGTPGGARVELTDEGLTAFDTGGTETAQIRGAGGEFVGGVFRTSDGLPGQVILSDEGYVDSSNGVKYPGIRIIPVDSSELVSPPGIGPNSNGFVITGGRNITGGRGYSIYSPNLATMSFVEGSTRSDVKVGKEYAWVTAYDENGNQGEVLAKSRFAQVGATAADGSRSFVEAGHGYAIVATRDPGGNLMSQIMSSGRSAYLRSTGSDGLSRSLSVDSDGVWVKTNRSGEWESWNLEETANDTGWQSFPVRAGITASSDLAWRNKGGIIWFRGKVNGTWNANAWTTVVSGLPSGMTPAVERTSIVPHLSASYIRVQMTPSGTLRVYTTQTVTATLDVAGISFPLD